MLQIKWEHMAQRIAEWLGIGLIFTKGIAFTQLILPSANGTIYMFLVYKEFAHLHYGKYASYVIILPCFHVFTLAVHHVNITYMIRDTGAFCTIRYIYEPTIISREACSHSKGLRTEWGYE